MKDLFTYLCDFSIVTSVAILLAVVLRPVLKKGPSFVRCALWALVFLRLLVPVGLVEVLPSVSLFDSAEATVSVPQEEIPAGDVVTDDNAVRDPAQTPTVTLPAVQTPASDAIPDRGDTVSTPVADPDVPQVDQAPQVENVPQPETLPQPEGKTDVLFVLSVVWAVGVVAMLGYMLTSNLLLRHRVRGAIVYDSRIRVIDRDCSPFVFGLFRPIIYIPASVNKADWPHIIAHETSHIKRFDHVLKPLAFFVLCFYWYNPLVWAAYILLSKDIEYACDERTVKSMEGKDRKAYSLALLAVSQGQNIVFAPPLSFGKVSVKERIKRVMTRKVPVWAMCLTIVICASLLVLAALTPVAGDGAGVESDETTGESEANESGEDSGAEDHGGVVLSDPPTYEEVLALHEQDPATYRDPGALQEETKEMIRLEDGQWYQSYVYENFRYVYLSDAEAEVPGLWDFVIIGSAENAFLFNAGAVYEDDSAMTLYTERPIAVRGTLADGSEGYRYRLMLPDELTVCVEMPANEWGGTCFLTSIETLAIPESYAYLFKGMTGEVIVTGVVARDENGVFYLRGLTGDIGTSGDSSTWDPVSDFAYEENKTGVTITKYIGENTEIVIPGVIDGKPVTEIGQGAFQFLYQHPITSVTIPDSVTTIGMRAFADNALLVSVRLPARLRVIGAGAFQECYSLPSITMPDSLVEIGSRAFKDCESLSTVTFSDHLVLIDYEAFFGCTSLKSVHFPKSLETIGQVAFSRAGLETVVFEEGLKTIRDFAFFGTKLKEVVLPDSVTELEGLAFAECKQLQSVSLGKGLNTIGYNAFARCDLLSEIVIPDSVKIMSEYAFEGCDRLSAVKFEGDAPQPIPNEDVLSEGVEFSESYTLYRHEGAKGFESSVWSNYSLKIW